ncbi:hypothetical protein JCM10213_008492 [Rhodosporidiobolus nylandii]
MLGLSAKAKTLSLPHLSLSRTNSPSRQGSAQNSPLASPAATTASTTTPLSSAPSSGSLGERESTPPTSISASPRLKASRSNSPKVGAADAAPETEENEPKPSRRASFGASLTAFTSRSSSTSTIAAPTSSAPKSPSVPAGLTITPATAEHAVRSRSSSGDKSGLRPLRSFSGRGKARSKSSDRAQDLVAAAAAAAGAAATPAAGGAAAAPAAKKAGGMMGTMRRGLTLGSSQSQSGAVRSSSLPPVGTGAPVSGAGVVGGSPVLGSGTATPAQAYAQANGAGGGGVQLHQLAESYVGKVSLRLGEAVNKVFLPIPNGPGGIPNKEQEKAEAPYGGSAHGWKGRSAPRVLRSKEVGELIATELQAALHDPYLLRTLLRSSVLKALSLFLSRLSALLLLPSPSDPSLSPALFAPPMTVKEADSLPLPLRYNLQIVRCAYEVKRSLSIVADPAAGFPAFVEETLRPWRAKLAELMGRVMNPLIASGRLAVAQACVRAASEGAVPIGEGQSTLGLNGVPSPAPRQSATSQLRSLSLGRASPAPASGATTPTGLVPAPAVATAAALAGPSWLRDLSSFLDAFARLVARLECGQDADKWLVSVATTATWKGMLNTSARIIGAVGSNGAEQEKHVLAPPSPPPVKKGFLGGVSVKRSPSPPASPPLPTVELANAASTATSATARLAGPTPSLAPAPSDVAFVRLISDLELLEARLQAFLASSVSNPSAVLTPAAPPATPCPGGGSCGLCRTGRTFDEESSDSEDEDEDDDPRHGGQRSEPGRESRLALSAMREAMQALSALIVVVRASKDVGVIKQALEAKPVERSKKQQEDDVPAQPMTPSALFALNTAPAPSLTPAAGVNASPATVVTVLPPASSLSSDCPTLRSALAELPPLLLLHLLASRLPPSSGFRLPHTLWGLRGGWAEYASELRGFAAGEEWAPEVAWEMGSELERIVAERQMGGMGWERGEKPASEALRAAIRRAGGAQPEKH